MKIFIITECFCNSVKYEPLVYTYSFRDRKNALAKFNRMIRSFTENSKFIKSPDRATLRYKFTVYNEEGRPIKLIKLEESSLSNTKNSNPDKNK